MKMTLTLSTDHPALCRLQIDGEYCEIRGEYEYWLHADELATALSKVCRDSAHRMMTEHLPLAMEALRIAFSPSQENAHGPSRQL